MSGFDSLVSRLGDTYSQIARLELTALKEVGNMLSVMQIQSLKKYASKLEDEWKAYAKFEQFEICRYRLVASREFNYPAKGVSRSVFDFQELFTQIYDAKTNGPKQRARVGGEIQSQSTFNIGYTFAGSLGFVLTVPSERNLFEDKFDQSVDSFFDIFSIDNEDDVREMSLYLGDAVIKRTYDWSHVNYDNDFGVDVVWSTTSGKQKGAKIERNALGKIIEIIDRTSDKEVRQFRVSGSLIGMDTQTEKFRFAELGADGETFAGVIASDFSLSEEWTLNQRYDAEIEVEAVTQYATQQTKQTYRLKALIQTDQ